MRVFAAIKPPDEIRKIVGKYIAGLRSEFGNVRVRWESVEKLHITLRFEAKLDEGGLPGFLQAVRSAADRPAFNASINKAGVFTRRKGAGHLWFGIGDGRDEIAEISLQIHSALTAGDGQQPTSKINPHLTIGRFKRRGNIDLLVSKHVANKFAPVEFTVSEIAVFQSELTSAGSVYTKIAAFPVTGGK